MKAQFFKDKMISCPHNQGQDDIKASIREKNLNLEHPK